MKFIKNAFTTKSGDIVIGQKPNASIYLAVVLLLLSKVIQDYSEELTYAYQAALLYWAGKELLQGVNLWRKLLGLTVLVLTVQSVFSSLAQL